MLALRETVDYVSNLHALPPGFHRREQSAKHRANETTDGRRMLEPWPHDKLFM